MPWLRSDQFEGALLSPHQGRGWFSVPEAGSEGEQQTHLLLRLLREDGTDRLLEVRMEGTNCAELELEFRAE